MFRAHYAAVNDEFALQDANESFMRSLIGRFRGGEKLHQEFVMLGFQRMENANDLVIWIKETVPRSLSDFLKVLDNIEAQAYEGHYYFMEDPNQLKPVIKALVETTQNLARENHIAQLSRANNNEALAVAIACVEEAMQFNLFFLQTNFLDRGYQPRQQPEEDKEQDKLSPSEEMHYHIIKFEGTRTTCCTLLANAQSEIENIQKGIPLGLELSQLLSQYTLINQLLREAIVFPLNKASEIELKLSGASHRNIIAHKEKALIVNKVVADLELLIAHCIKTQDLPSQELSYLCRSLFSTLKNEIDGHKVHVNNSLVIFEEFISYFNRGVLSAPIQAINTGHAHIIRLVALNDYIHHLKQNTKRVLNSFSLDPKKVDTQFKINSYLALADKDFNMGKLEGALLHYSIAAWMIRCKVDKNPFRTEASVLQKVHKMRKAIREKECEDAIKQFAKYLPKKKKQNLASRGQKEKAPVSIEQAQCAEENLLDLMHQLDIEQKKLEIKNKKQVKAAAKRKAAMKKREAEATAKREAEATVKREAEATAKREAEATVKREAEATVKREAEATVQREAEATVKREAEATVKREAEATVKREAEAMVKREAEATVKREAEAMVKREAEAMVKREAEAMVKREAEAMVKREAEAMVKREAEATVKREAEATVKREAEATVKRELEISVQEEKECLLSDFYPQDFSQELPQDMIDLLVQLSLETEGMIKEGCLEKPHLQLIGSFVLHWAMLTLNMKITRQPEDLDLFLHAKNFFFAERYFLVSKLEHLGFVETQANPYQAYVKLSKPAHSASNEALEKKRLSIDITLAFKEYQKSINPNCLTRHVLQFNNVTGMMSYNAGDKRLQRELIADLKGCLFRVDLNTVLHPSLSVVNLFSRLLKFSFDYRHSFFLDLKTTGLILRDLATITFYFKSRLNKFCLAQYKINPDRAKAMCYFEMATLIEKGFFTQEEAKPIIEGFVNALLEEIYSEHLIPADMKNQLNHKATQITLVLQSLYRDNKPNINKQKRVLVMDFYCFLKHELLHVFPKNLQYNIAMCSSVLKLPNSLQPRTSSLLDIQFPHVLKQKRVDPISKHSSLLSLYGIGWGQKENASCIDGRRILAQP